MLEKFVYNKRYNKSIPNIPNIPPEIPLENEVIHSSTLTVHRMYQQGLQYANDSYYVSQTFL